MYSLLRQNGDSKKTVKTSDYMTKKLRKVSQTAAETKRCKKLIWKPETEWKSPDMLRFSQGDRLKGSWSD